jgi:hypothetical protein
MNPGVGLYVALTPMLAGAVGAIALLFRRTRLYRDAASRSSRSRAEIDKILLDAKIREAKARAAESGEAA